MARINNAHKLSEVSSEMRFQLPNDSIRDFKEFFKALDQRKEELGLKSYGIGVTTLEEVFLKVCEGKQIGEIEDFQAKNNQKFNLDENIGDDYCLLDDSVAGFGLIKLQLYAMTLARIKMIFRHLRPIVFEILYPSLLIIFGAVIMALSLNGTNLLTHVQISDFPMKQDFNYAEYSPLVNQETSTEFIDGVFNNKYFAPIHRKIENEENLTLKERFEVFDEILYRNK